MSDKTIGTTQQICKRRRLTAQLKNLTVVSINVGGLTQDKAQILSDHYRDSDCDMLCVQETHCGPDKPKPKIFGFELVLDYAHPKYGSAMFTKPGQAVESKAYKVRNTIEILSIVTGGCVVVSIYKPPRRLFEFTQTENFFDSKFKIVIGDFNSHCVDWGYKKTNRSGKEVKRWAEAESLSLLHSDQLQRSFYSGRWKSWYNPDLLFFSANMNLACRKEVDQLPILNTAAHRPIVCRYTAQ